MGEYLREYIIDAVILIILTVSAIIWWNSDPIITMMILFTAMIYSRILSVEKRIMDREQEIEKWIEYGMELERDRRDV